MNALHVFTVDAHQHVWDAAQVDYPRLGADTDAMFAIAVLHDGRRRSSASFRAADRRVRGQDDRRASAREGPCPVCGVITGAAKARPLMRLKDLPACGQVVRLGGGTAHEAGCGRSAVRVRVAVLTAGGWGRSGGGAHSVISPRYGD